MRALLAAPDIRIDLANEDGETALFIACHKHHLLAVQALLLRGAHMLRRVFGEDWEDATPLSVAAVENHADVARELVLRGADINVVETASGMTPLIYAASRWSFSDGIPILLQLGANVNTCTEPGTALLEAAICGSRAAVRALLVVPSTYVTLTDSS